MENYRLLQELGHFRVNFFQFLAIKTCIQDPDPISSDPFNTDFKTFHILLEMNNKALLLSSHLYRKVVRGGLNNNNTEKEFMFHECRRL